MLIVTKRRYKKQHVIGGSGIFDNIANFLKRLISSNAAKQIASTALSAGKTAAKEIGKTAVEVGKTTAIDAGKKLIDKASEKIFTPNNQKTITKFTGLEAQPKIITQKTKDILDRIVNKGATNINNILAGSGTSNAIAIQDLVRKLNGAGMKTV